MTHLLAATPARDGGGLFALALSLVASSLGLSLIFNYRGMADRIHGRMILRGTRRARGSMSPASWRRYGGIWLLLGLTALSFAIGRFAQGGY